MHFNFLIILALLPAYCFIKLNLLTALQNKIVYFLTYSVYLLRKRWLRCT